MFSKLWNQCWLHVFFSDWKKHGEILPVAVWNGALSVWRLFKRKGEGAASLALITGCDPKVSSPYLFQLLLSVIIFICGYLSICQSTQPSLCCLTPCTFTNSARLLLPRNCTYSHFVLCSLFENSNFWQQKFSNFRMRENAANLQF